MKKISKKIWIPILVVSILLVIGISTILFFTLSKDKVTLSIAINQVDEEQLISVEWNTSKSVDKVKIEVYHNKDLVSSETICDSSSILKGQTEIYAYYGKMTVTVTVSGDDVKTTSKSTEIGVSASEYNIAPISATMPVTIFSLSLSEITNDYSIPTFVWFKRSEVWNYSNLPDNVYTMPVATASEITSNSNQSLMYARTSAWVAELYEINPSSHFNLFYNDYYAYGWLQATVANGIPEENYNVYLLSDGTASFEYFNEHFDNENAETEYATMKSNYETLKEQVAEAGNYAANMKNFIIDAGTFREYAYICAKEESNVEWWLTRINGTIAPNNENVYNEVASLDSVKVKDLNTLLNALTEEQQQDLKNLYNFSDTMFEEAESQNKKVMVILGTWTVNEENFDSYVKAVMAYYGDDYVYYYKGHPKDPTYSVDGKLEKLESLGLIDLDSTIPAELIYFFNQDIYISGYQSTTFLSIDEDSCCGLFNCRIDDFSEVYKSSMEFFISSVSSTDEKYGSFVSGNNCYVLEFVDTTAYSFAIYNDSTNTITYYIEQDGTYIAV